MGAAVAVFLLFWASSFATALFPQVFSDTGGELVVRPTSVPTESDKTLIALPSGCVGGHASTAGGQLPFGTLEKYTALSCEWIFA